MAGAVAISLAGYRLVLGRGRPLLAERFHLPTGQDIDVRLVGGAALFGAGWGLGGFCPGPAVTALALAAPGTLIFVAAMLAGMWLARGMAGRLAAKVHT
jgi:hypothetical protein